MSLSAFESRLLGDREQIDRDNARLSDDEFKASMRSAASGPQGPLLAMNDAGAPGGADAMPGEAMDIRRSLVAPVMSDVGGPQLGPGPAYQAPPPAQTMAGWGPPPGPPPGLPPPYHGLARELMTPEQKAANPLPGQPMLAKPPPTVIPAPRPVQTGPGVPGGLQAAVNADHAAELGTYDQERAQQSALTGAQVAKQSYEGQLGSKEAARQEKAALDLQAEADKGDEYLTSYLKRSDKINNDLATQKFDPNRAYHNASDAGKVGIIIGGFLGNIIPGVNQLMSALDLSTADEVTKQREEYERGQKGLANRNTIFGHFFEANKNKHLSMLETQNALMTANKTRIAAQVQSAGVPETIAKGDMAVTAIDRAQAQLKTQIDKARLQAAQAAAAAWSQQQRAAEERTRQHEKDVAELGLKGRALDIEAEKANGANGKGAEEVRKRTVVVAGPDGKPQAREAIDADSAKSFREYAKISGEAQRLLHTMQKSQNTAMGGAEYDAAKSKLIEIMPTLYGYARGPSVAQVEHTFGPESIPDHYTGLNPANAFGRAGEIKLNDLSKTLGQIDKDTYNETFLPGDNPKANGGGDTPPGFEASGGSPKSGDDSLKAFAKKMQK